ncbi:MAG: ABC transporter permease [Euryarchaeota archaeon]|nr:ABC transporter permease [Euryarchaeota archaeon]
MFSELEPILAIVKKETRIHWRYRIWLLVDILTPLIWVLMLIFFGRAFGRGLLAGIDYISFLLIGMIMFNFVSFAMWGVGFTLRMEQWQGTLEANFLAPIHRTSLLIGKFIASSLTATFSILVILLFVKFTFGLKLNVGSWSLIALTVILTVFCAYGFSVLIASLVLIFKEPGALMSLFEAIFLFLCGVFYPITVMPSFLQAISKFIPFTHSLIILRAALFEKASFILVYNSLLILIVFSIALPIVGHALFSYVERQVKIRGTLAHY